MPGFLKQAFFCFSAGTVRFWWIIGHKMCIRE